MLCNCIGNYQILLWQHDQRHHYIHAFSGSCGSSVTFKLNSSGNYWVTIFHESMEGIFEGIFLYSGEVKLDYSLNSEVTTKRIVTTNTTISISICK